MLKLFMAYFVAFVFRSCLFASLVLVAGLSIAADARTPAENAGMSQMTAGGDRTTLSTYRLGAGDVVTIRVFGEEDLSREKIKLTDAGTVPYPVLGEIRVLGRTVGDLERHITEGLRGRYLVNPRVSVLIEEYRPFYINGMVERPGGYPFQPGLTVRKAASLAGGFKERASMSKIFVIREGDTQQKPERAELSTLVFPGDILTVEESFF